MLNVQSLPGWASLSPRFATPQWAWPRLAALGAIASSLGHFVAAFSVLRWNLAADGAVTCVHAPTGSAVTLRADGNIDFAPARNLYLKPKGLTLLSADCQAVDERADAE